MAEGEDLRALASSSSSSMDLATPLESPRDMELATPLGSPRDVANFKSLPMHLFIEIAKHLAPRDWLALFSIDRETYQWFRKSMTYVLEVVPSF